MFKVKKVSIENGINDYVEYFNSFFYASIIYAIIGTLLIYKHINGIGATLFIISTCVYSIYCMEASGVKIKNGSKMLIGIIILLSISSILTNDWLVVFVNFLFMFITIIVMLIYNYVSDDNWQLAEYIRSFLKTLFCSIGLLSEVFPDLEDKTKHRLSLGNDTNDDNKNEFKVSYVVIGIIISIVILILVMPSLLSADYIFDEFVKNIFKLNFTDIICILIIAVFLTFSSFCGIKCLNLGESKIEVSEKQKFNKWIGVTVFTIISIVYISFSIIQIFGLFLNKLELPHDETFSSYARNGFFQLLYVATINLIMIVVSFYAFDKSKIIKVLLSIISINTFIMLASSMYRLILYIDSYELTKLRLYAFWGLIVVLFGLTEAVISIYSDKFKFAKVGFVTLLALWTILSFMRPEYIISKYNYESRITKDKPVDYKYLCTFSSDASSVIYDLINEEIITLNLTTHNYISSIKEKYDLNNGLNFNFSVKNSEKLLTYFIP